VVMSAEAAVKQAEQSRPDVVLMDISLHSDMDGIEAAKEIHSRFGIPIIYMTGYVNPEVKERAMAAGPIGYFVKPVDCRAVQKTIEAALSES
jgi:CheY-like chemotaxis protein